MDFFLNFKGNTVGMVNNIVGHIIAIGLTMLTKRWSCGARDEADNNLLYGFWPFLSNMDSFSRFQRQ